jgi:hypothetical protein
MKLHPDKGGTATEFKEMLEEYKRFDEPGYRFNTINQNRYQDGYFGQTFNPFRSYTESNNEKALQEQLKALSARHQRLYEECKCLQNHNSQLEKANAIQTLFISELKEHWLIGRLLKWFRMSDC